VCSLRYGKKRRFNSGSAHLGKFRNFSRRQTALPTDLWVATEITEIRCITGVTVLFVCLDRPLRRIFWRHLYHFWSDYTNNFTVKFSEFFYVRRNGWNKFQEPKIWRESGCPHLRFLTSGGLRPPKGTLLEYLFSIVPLFRSKAFSCRLCAANCAIFGSGSALVKNFRIFFWTAESATHSFMRLPPRSRGSVVYNWSCDAFLRLDPPLHRLFWRYLCRFWSDWK